MRVGNNHFEQAKQAAKRLYQKVNFQGGALQNFEISSLMQQTYDYLKIPFKPTTNDIKQFGKVLDANGDGSVTLQDLETMAVSYLCGQGIMDGQSAQKSAGYIPSSLDIDQIRGNSTYSTSDHRSSNYLNESSSSGGANLYGLNAHGSSGSSYLKDSYQAVGGSGSKYTATGEYLSSSDFAGSSSNKYLGSANGSKKDFLNNLGGLGTGISSTNSIGGTSSYLQNKSTTSSIATDFKLGGKAGSEFSDPNFLKNMNDFNTGASYGGAAGAGGYENPLKKYNDYGLNDYGLSGSSSKANGYTSPTASASYDYTSTTTGDYSFNKKGSGGSYGAADYGSGNYGSSSNNNIGNNDYSSYDSHHHQRQQYQQSPASSTAPSRYTAQAQNYLNITRRLFFKHCNRDSETITRDAVASLLTETYQALGRSGYHPNDEDVNVWMKLCDTNSDGHVEEAEYEYFVIRALERSGVEVNK